MTEPVASPYPHLRIARPVRDLDRTSRMYQAGLGLKVIGEFRDHDGFNGVMLGTEDAHYHFEFTVCSTHAVQPTPTAEDLIVFYLPAENEWRATATQMEAAGFKVVASFNPYWDIAGKTFEDADGYRIVLQRAAWINRASTEE